MKTHLLILTILFSAISYSQIETKIKFNILFAKNEPAPGVNIIVKNSKPTIGTQTDLNGNAELLGIKENDVVEISYMGPTAPSFALQKSVDSIAINLEKQIAIYYSKNKKLKKIRFQR
jgi:hypothetical protein